MIANPRSITETITVDFDDEQIEVDVTAMVYPPIPDSMDCPGSDWSIEVLKWDAPDGLSPSDANWEIVERAARDDIALWIDAYTDAKDRDECAARGEI